MWMYVCNYIKVSQTIDKIINHQFHQTMRICAHKKNQLFSYDKFEPIFVHVKLFLK